MVLKAIESFRRIFSHEPDISPSQALLEEFITILSADVDAVIGNRVRGNLNGAATDIRLEGDYADLGRLVKRKTFFQHTIESRGSLAVIAVPFASNDEPLARHGPDSIVRKYWDRIFYATVARENTISIIDYGKQRANPKKWPKNLR